jgi:hypothetical protein
MFETEEDTEDSICPPQDEEKENHAPSNYENHPPSNYCNFVLPTQNLSSSEEDTTPQYFTQDLEEEEEEEEGVGKCDPPGLTSWDVAGVIERGKRVKLSFFDPNPYPGECNYAGSVSSSGFPFGCKTLGMNPICCTIFSYV